MQCGFYTNPEYIHAFKPNIFLLNHSLNALRKYLGQPHPSIAQPCDLERAVKSVDLSSSAALSLPAAGEFIQVG